MFINIFIFYEVFLKIWHILKSYLKDLGNLLTQKFALTIRKFFIVFKLSLILSKTLNVPPWWCFFFFFFKSGHCPLFIPKTLYSNSAINQKWLYFLLIFLLGCESQSVPCQRLYWLHFCHFWSFKMKSRIVVPFV